MALNLKKVPIEKIKGLDDSQRHGIEKLGINDVYDLLTWFPYKYKNIDPQSLGLNENKNEILPDGKVVEVKVSQMTSIYAEPLKSGAIRIYFKAILVNGFGQSKFSQRSDDEIHVNIHFDVFRLDKYAKIFDSSQYYNVIGHYSLATNTISLTSYDGAIQAFRPSKPFKVHLLGLYHTQKGVSQGAIRHAIYRAYSQYGKYFPETITAKIRREEKLLVRKDALLVIHFPKGKNLLKNAIKTEKFNELYVYELKLQRINYRRKHRSGFKIKFDKKLLDKFESNLPFKLTNDQENAKKDVLLDLEEPYKMTRLLQGDVGSGKTIVAAIGILATISAGYQAALMAPTSVLSEQHYGTFKRIFKKLDIKIALLNGRTSAKKRREIRKGLADGSIDLVIGTHSLFQKSLKYKNLGMAVIDEQQLFGVHQRKALSNKTNGCNVLSLTATPIPRTLAISLFGSMDTSIINQMPKGRKTVKTKWYPKLPAPDLKSIIVRAIKKHGQVFVVTRLVKPSARIHQTDTKTTCYRLNKLLNPTYKAMELHSQMPNHTKEKVIKSFKTGKCQVLVATTIIGVGMDISNANLIIIYDAEDYGLAQLHQLRGRVGRSDKQSYCVLIGDTKKKNGRKRLKAMEHIHDGFKLSRVDLKMRHWGNLFGKMQHGLPDFKLADLSQESDMEILTLAQKHAHLVVRNEHLARRKRDKK